MGKPTCEKMNRGGWLDQMFEYVGQNDCIKATHSVLRQIGLRDYIYTAFDCHLGRCVVNFDTEPLVTWTQRMKYPACATAIVQNSSVCADLL